jgi:HK97 family phage portal protein
MSVLSVIAKPFRFAAGAIMSVVHISSKAIAEVFGLNMPTVAGVPMDEHKALSISAVWAAVRLLSNTVGFLPLQFFEYTPDGRRQRATTHNVARLLADRPNPATSWPVFCQTLQGHAVSWGNGYAAIEWNGAGEVSNLWQLTPDRVSVDLDPRTKLPSYLVDGAHRLSLFEVIHIGGFGFDGLVGYCPVRIARESLSSAAAQERYGAAFFGNGGRPGGVLVHPKKLSPEARKAMREEWDAIHQGSGNANKVAVLVEGLEFKPFDLPPEEAQFIETRKFSISEIARWFNVPPHMIRDLDRSTHNNIEWQGREFLTYSILPWLTTWVEELKFKLLTEDERQKYYFRHRVDALLRGDIVSRYKAYAIGRQWGWLSANDVLELEDMDPIGDGGNVYLTPMNMAPAGEGEWQPVSWMPSRAPAASMPTPKDPTHFLEIAK